MIGGRLREVIAKEGSTVVSFNIVENETILSIVSTPY